MNLKSKIHYSLITLSVIAFSTLLALKTEAASSDSTTSDQESGQHTDSQVLDPTAPAVSDNPSETKTGDARDHNRPDPAIEKLPADEAGPQKLADGQGQPAIEDPRTSRVFGKGAPFVINDLPDGKLKENLLALTPENKIKALEWLHSFMFSGIDAVESLRADSEGGIFYSCFACDGHGEGCAHHSLSTTSSTESATAREESSEESSEPTTPVVAAAAVSINSPPIYNSKPDAPSHIYLDFNGAVVTGKQWNTSYGVESYDCLVWGDTNGTKTTFSDNDQAEMRRVWERVAEDYSSFNINVTTDAQYDPDNTSYSGDRNQVGWLLFTPNIDKNGVNCPHRGAGGVAYVGVFGNDNYFSRYQPAWVLPTNSANMTEAASHEMGHNMGLSHDTQSDIGYYNGHGSGDTSWGPIMGTGYGRNVSQWSKGEYHDSKHASYNGSTYDNNANTNDDLLIISNRVSYRTDDHGDDTANATRLTPDQNGSITQAGIVETTDDPDVFEFAANAGTVVFNATTFKSDTSTNGGNLDINLELRDSSGALIASNNPATDVNASISQSIPAGDYYLIVKPTGVGSPMNNPPSGYTSYGSLGQYSITGNFVLPGDIILSSPDNGEEWTRNASHPIIWFSDVDGNVKIELFKGGSLNSVLAESTPNDGLFDWMIPSGQAGGSDYTIKITSIDIPSKFDGSALDFTVLLESNDILIADMDTNPGFSATGLFEFGTPSGVNDVQNANTGTNIYDTDLDGTASTASTLTTFALDCSNHSNVNLEFWAHTYLNQNFTALFEVSSDNSNWTQLLSQGGMSTREWTKYEYDISAVADGQPNVYVRWSMLGSGIQNVGGGVAIDDVKLSGLFVPANGVYVIGPNGGENWFRELQNQITWSSGLEGNVKIELWKGESLDTTLASNTTNDGSYSWTTPVDQAVGSDYSVRIESIENSSSIDESDTDFSIISAPVFVGLPYSEDFAGLNNDWTQPSSDTLDWTRNSGPTATLNTGPNTQVDDFYLYTQALGNTNKIAEFTCWFDLRSAVNPEFSFRYHMYGSDMGTLKVEGSSDDANWVSLFNESGDKGNIWNLAQLDLSAFVGKYLKLRISGMTGPGSTSDMAIDDFLMLETYIVSYSSNTSDSISGNIPSNQVKRQNVELTLADASTISRADYTCTGWNSISNGSGTAYALGGNYTIDASINLYARWSLTTYEAWAGTGTSFSGDTNDDGISNGLAWLLGAEDSSESALALLPKGSESSEDLVMNFSLLNSDSRGGALVSVQYSKDLGVSDAWTNHTVIVPENTSNVDGVNFEITPNGNLNQVQVTIPSDQASAAGKLFSRVRVETP